MNDKITNLINNIKTGGRAGKEFVQVPFSKMNSAILEVLTKTGFIESFSKKGRKSVKLAEVRLAYDEDKKPKLTGAVRASRPSKRIYISVKEIKKVKNGYGRLVISTPKGIMSGEDARKLGVGGEPLFEVW